MGGSGSEKWKKTQTEKKIKDKVNFLKQVFRRENRRGNFIPKSKFSSLFYALSFKNSDLKKYSFIYFSSYKACITHLVIENLGDLNMWKIWEMFSEKKLDKHLTNFRLKLVSNAAWPIYMSWPLLPIDYMTYIYVMESFLKNWQEIKNMCLGDQGKFYGNTYTTQMNKFRCCNAKLYI